MKAQGHGSRSAPLQASRGFTLSGRPSIVLKGRVAGAVFGALFAGLLLAVWMLVGEAVSGHPSQLTVMVRHVGGWFGALGAPASHVPTITEEYEGLAGHLVLAATAGAAYALAWRQDRRWTVQGLLFGAAFFLVCHAVIGPIVGLTPPIWTIGVSDWLLGAVINGLFGLCTAGFAHLVGGSRLSIEAAHS